jgi:hypothetical protein
LPGRSAPRRQPWIWDECVERIGGNAEKYLQPMKPRQSSSCQTQFKK